MKKISLSFFNLILKAKNKIIKDKTRAETLEGVSSSIISILLTNTHDDFQLSNKEVGKVLNDVIDTTKHVLKMRKTRLENELIETVEVLQKI